MDVREHLEHVVSIACITPRHLTTVVCLVYSVVMGRPNSVTVSWVVTSDVTVEISVTVVVVKEVLGRGGGAGYLGNRLSLCRRKLLLS